MSCWKRRGGDGVNLKVPANRQCVVAPIACGQITSRESVDTRQEKLG